MARTKRSEVFDPDAIGVYHCFNRIVRRSHLCGFDPHTGNDYSHRRQWFYQRLRHYAQYFAIDVLAYAILSNHFHLVLRNRPDQVEAMDDREVVVAWLMICPQSGKQPDGSVEPPTEPEIRSELNKPDRVPELRKRLSNPSWLIRQVSQYMGIRCNAEDEMRGHFWESRYGMTRLLDEAAILACLAYVDLNPIRSHLVDSLEAYRHVSIGERLRTLDDEAIDTSSWLAPIALHRETNGKAVTVANRVSREGVEKAIETQSQEPLGCLPIRLEQYAELLRWLAGDKSPAERDAGVDEQETNSATALAQLGLDPTEFFDLVHNFRKRFFTAAGDSDSLRREAARRGKRRLNGPGRRGLSRSGPRRAESSGTTA